VTRSPVEVRRAVIEDLDDLLLLWSQAREEVARGGRTPGGIPLDQIRPRLAESLGSPDIHILLARWEGRVAGYAVLRVAPLLAVVDGPALHIDHLFVQPSARRHGVARGLLSAATAIAERQGAEQILASAAPSAKDTHRFLARLGFFPLVVRRAVGTATLRRRLAGEGQRSGLEDLLSRRRSLRARALRAGWVGGGDATSAPIDDDVEEPRPDDGPVGLGPVVRLDLQAIEICADQVSVPVGPAIAAGAAVTGAAMTGATAEGAAAGSAVTGTVVTGSLPNSTSAVVGPPRTPESMPIGRRRRSRS